MCAHTLSRCLILLIIFTLQFACRNVYTNDGYIKCDALTVPSNMRCVPGGAFIRGSNRYTHQEDTQEKIRDEFPEEKVAVSTFLMDTYEVTYSQYQACVKSGACTPAGPLYKNYDGPNQPMVGLNWYQARSYCQWQMKRLPTEAEFEKAARGTHGELYPWGNQPADCNKAVIKYNDKRSCGVGGIIGVTFNVGSRPAYRYGLYDIAGNSWEWVNDWYSSDYNACGRFCKEKNPQGPCNGADTCPGHDRKVVKGGSWYWSAEYALGSNRRPHFPANRPYHHYGFRCAKYPQL